MSVKAAMTVSTAPDLDVRPQFLDCQHESEPIAPLKPSDRRG